MIQSKTKTQMPSSNRYKTAPTFSMLWLVFWISVGLVSFYAQGYPYLHIYCVLATLMWLDCVIPRPSIEMRLQRKIRALRGILAMYHWIARFLNLDNHSSLPFFTYFWVRYRNAVAQNNKNNVKKKIASRSNRSN